MRKCVRCGAAMEEDYKLTGGYGNVIRKKGNIKACYPKAALCPRCGEISLYVEGDNLEKMTK